jgi:hypothetical protein
MGPVVPLGSEERKKKLQYSHIGMGASTKLNISEAMAGQHSTTHAGSLLKEKRKHRLFDTPWESSPTGPATLDMRLNRPDYVGFIQANVVGGYSELRHKGQHVLAVSSEPQPDFTSSRTCALSGFNPCEARSRMHD